MAQILWSEEKLREGFEKFYKENNRYPTALEIDAYSGLPSSRQIQRTYGGLVQLRKKLQLSGPTDYTKGEHSSRRASTIGARSHSLEKNVYELLIKRFGEMRVHREYMFKGDRRSRADFYVYCKEGNFLVDVFYPNDKHSLSSCLNSKLKTYSGGEDLGHPTIFLMMNTDIGDEILNEVIKNKKNKLGSHQSLMTLDMFKHFLQGRTPA